MPITPKNVEEILSELKHEYLKHEGYTVTYSADGSVREPIKDWLKQSLVSFLEDVKGKMPKKADERKAVETKDFLVETYQEKQGWNHAIDSCLDVIDSIQKEIK